MEKKMKTNMMNFRKSYIVKTISMLLLQSFLFTNIGFAAVEDLKPDSNGVYARGVSTPEDINLPKDIGLIRDTHTGAGKRLIVHIQDAHCNYEAQTNISRIIETLSDKHDINLVSLEGADGNVDTKWFRSFPDAEIRRKVSDYFLKKGELTGAEFLSITEGAPVKLVGAEDRALYAKNLKIFNTVYPARGETEKYLSDVRTALRKLKTYVYSKRMKGLDSEVEAFENEKTSLSDYARFLNKNIEKHGLKLQNYPNFARLIRTLGYEEKIDFDTVNEERTGLIDKLTEIMPENKLEKLVKRSVLFKAGKIGAAEYHAYLKEVSDENGVQVSRECPNLEMYVVYAGLYEKIKNQNLFNELGLIKNALKEKIISNEDERKLSALWDNLKVLSNLVKLELLNKDYDYYKTHKNEFKPRVFSEFINKKIRMYNLAFSIEEPNTLVRENLPKWEKFYEIGLKRDKALINNTLKAMDKNKASAAYLISGGFHTEGIKRILEKKGVSYIVVCPVITKEADSPYIKVLTNRGLAIPFLISKLVPMKGAAVRGLVRGTGVMEGEPDLAARRAKFIKAWVEQYAPLWKARFDRQRETVARATGMDTVEFDEGILARAFAIAVFEGAREHGLDASLRDEIEGLVREVFQLELVTRVATSTTGQTARTDRTDRGRQNDRRESGRNPGQRVGGGRQGTGGVRGTPIRTAIGEYEGLTPEQDAAFREILRESFAEGTF
ncbi:MAG: hypothetical protein NG712_05710, partial [Omnitrophica bacterium]|nr:hypothetical protein [Candidatus Omnitrophota bacterium]